MFLKSKVQKMKKVLKQYITINLLKSGTSSMSDIMNFKKIGVLTELQLVDVSKCKAIKLTTEDNNTPWNPPSLLILKTTYHIPLCPLHCSMFTLIYLHSTVYNDNCRSFLPPAVHLNAWFSSDIWHKAYWQWPGVMKDDCSVQWTCCMSGGQVSHGAMWPA